MKVIKLLFLLSIVNFQCFSQVLNIHSITHLREPIVGGAGYTLDATSMDTSSRLKLLSPINFGTGGFYSKSVNIIDGFSASNSLIQVFNFPYTDLFFFGVFNKNDGALVQFTNEEIDSLYNWSKRGGKLIICGSASPDGLSPIASNGDYNPFVLNSKWGFQITQLVPSSFIPTSVGLNTDIFNGSFGSVNSASQGGGAQGYFSLLPSNVSVLARDVNNNPTIIMDCNTLDLIVADVDGYTSLTVSAGSAITNDQDKFFANTIVFMDKLQPLPQITKVSNTLSLNSTYNNYKWYVNNSPINGAINSTYTISDTGSYYVETTVNGGCKVKSKSIYVSSTTDILEIKNINSIKIYPNPAQQFFNIELPKEQNFTLLVYDITGRIMYENKNAIGTVKVDCRNFSNGIYFVKAVNQRTVLTGKMVKE